MCTITTHCGGQLVSKEFPDPNLHVYGRDDIKTRVYSMEMWPKGGRGTKKKQRNLCNDPLNSCNLVYQ